jgi:Uma2 family endonuclease
MFASAAESTQAQLDKALPGGVVFPPGDLDSDEPPLETELHLRQILLLIQSLEWLWSERQDFYSNLR